MSYWDGFRFHQLIELPRSEGSEGEHARSADERSGLLAATLTGAHADLLGTGEQAAALLTAWVRGPEDRRLRFLLGGRPFFPPASGTHVNRTMRQVLFPPGAVACELSAQDAARLLDAFPCWVPCSGRADALWTSSRNRQEQVAVRRGLFDQHVAHLGDPFAWVVAAEPLRPEEVKPELDLLVNEILPLSRGEVGEAKRIALERKQARHRELSRAQVGGTWLIRVLVGGMDRRGAATAAATLCASCELEGLAYVMAPAGPAMALSDAARAKIGDQHGNRVPIATGTELLVALSRPPERELPGLRLVDPHTFDVTPENADGTGLHLGTVLDEARTAVDNLTVDRDALNRHTFVCGATGAGKSQTVRHLLSEASRTGLPWLVVEPAKAEYVRMATRIAPLGQDVVVIRPGDPDVPPAGFNPLKPVPGFALQTHVDLVRALFLAAFESAEPFPQVLAAALTRCYEELGWDLVLGNAAQGGQPRYPTLGDLQRVAADVVTEIGYGKDVSADVQGFIKVRLSSLRLGTTGRFFEGGHPLDFTRLRSRNVVFEIEDVGDDADKAFLMGAVLMQLSEHLRVEHRRYGRREELSHITVIEEAHRLLRRAQPGTSGPAAHAVEMFAAMLAEVRAYGEGLIIAEQIPSKLTTEVIKNTAVKIVHRLPAQDDRDSVGATMNLDEAQSRYVVTLEPGYGAVFTDRMDRPMLVHVPDGSELEEAQGIATAPVTGLIDRRSPTCGPACVTEPCTLSQMRKAQLLLAEQRWLTLWAELTVLAHLAGHTAPVVDEAQLRTIAANAPVTTQILECAISHAVDDAVAVRSPLLQPDVYPTDLARHCVTVLQSAFAGGGPREVCAGDGLRYLARHYRWLTAWVALEKETGDDTLHPETATWERRFGSRIPGNNRTEQRAAVKRWWGNALADQDGRDAVTFGTRRPSTVESIIGGSVTDPDWDARVREALEPFPSCEWPKVHLVPVARQNTT
jgi:uncharacterized protein